MVQCPWCGNDVELVQDCCPECKTEVLPEHLSAATAFAETGGGGAIEEEPGDRMLEGAGEDLLDVPTAIMNRFICCKCKGQDCSVEEVAMTGTGFSKLLDIQNHHYLFVSCDNCGYVEVYNPDVLRGQKSGGLGTVLDVLFG